MTHREAVTIALRNLGMSEDAIKRSHAKADQDFIDHFGKAMLKSEIEKQIKLPPGTTEADYLKFLQGQFLAFSLLTSDQKEKRRADSLERTKRHTRQN